MLDCSHFEQGAIHCFFCMPPGEHYRGCTDWRSSCSPSVPGSEQLGLRMPLSLDFATLRRAYSEGTTSPISVAREILARIAARGLDGVWITRVSDHELLRAATALERRAAAQGTGPLPLYGLPFAVKDNIA